MLLFLFRTTSKDIVCGHARKMCDALNDLLNNILIQYCSKLYGQIVGILMGTNCATLVLFCYERHFMFNLSLSDNNQADVIQDFNSTSRYLEDLLNTDNSYFEQMVISHIYPTELQLNKANSFDTEAVFWTLLCRKRMT